MAEKGFITGVVCLDKNFWRLAGYNFLLRKFHLCFLRNWPPCILLARCHRVDHENSAI